MIKFTKGPWKMVENSWEYTTIYSNDSEICTLNINDATEDNEIELSQVMEANAHLIAAAPDLYEALEEIINSEWMVTHDWGGDRNSVMEKGRKALAKARGKEDT